MATSARGFTGVLALAAVLLASGSARAQTPADRVALRKQAERRISTLEDRLAALAPQGLAAEIQADMARRHVELARKLLKYNNEQAAKVMLDQADWFANRAAGQEVKQ